jgi:hypothetical protein
MTGSRGIGGLLVPCGPGMESGENERKPMGYTFDGKWIQDDVTERCRAFSGEPLRLHLVRIYGDRTIRVWDSVAGHFTTCHALTKRAQKRILEKHVK